MIKISKMVLKKDNLTNDSKAKDKA